MTMKTRKSVRIQWRLAGRRGREQARKAAVFVQPEAVLTPLLCLSQAGQRLGCKDTYH